MDWVVILTIIASFATILGLFWIIFIGQKNIYEWWREKRRGSSVKPKLTKMELSNISTIIVGEQMIAAVKTSSEPGLDLAMKPMPSIRPSEVLLRVQAASICGTDLAIYQWNQWAQSRIHPPVVPGHEFCGTVIEKGYNVTNIEVGDFVASESHIACGSCSYCKSGYPNVCLNSDILGMDRDGAFAEYVVIPARNAWKLPPNVPIEIATLMEPFGNAVHAALSQDLTGRNVLITGAGPIGLMTIAVSRWAGANVICASDLFDYRLDLANQMGADVTINAHRNKQDIEKVVYEATDGQGVDIFMEMSGASKALDLGLTVLRNTGRAVLMGIYEQPIPIDFTNKVTFKGITIYGAYGRLADRNWERMRDVLASGGIDLRPIITHEFRLDQLDKAFEVVQSRQACKVIIRPLHNTIINQPIHFNPIAPDQPIPSVLWHDAYSQQAKEIIEDSKGKELFLLKNELDDLFTSAQELQQTIYGYRRQLLDPKTDIKLKSQLNAQISELETHVTHLRGE